MGVTYWKWVKHISVECSKRISLTGDLGCSRNCTTIPWVFTLSARLDAKGVAKANRRESRIIHTVYCSQ